MKTKVLAACLYLCLFFAAPPQAWGQAQPHITRCFQKTGTLVTDTLFGQAIAVNSQFIVSGNPAAQGPAPGFASQRGVVNVFSLATGAFVRAINPPSGDAGLANLNFGTSVALHGSTLVVGAPGSTNVGAPKGAVFLFNVATGVFLNKLTPATAAAGFGTCVAMHGGQIAIGSPLENSGRGAAYLFDFSTGNLLLRLQASDGASGDGFGTAIALSSNWLLVGAPGDNTGRGTDAGSGYLFDAASPFTQVRKLTDEGFTPDNTTGASSALGSSVAIYGPELFLGAPGDTVGAETDAGAVFIFVANEPNAIRSVTHPDGALAADRFGTMLAAGDFLVAASAPRKSLHGIVMLDVRNLSPTAFLVPTPQGLDFKDEFGTGLAMLGNRLIASTAQDFDGTQLGAVFKLDPLLRPDATAGGVILQQGDPAPEVPGTQFSNVDTNFFDNGALNSAVVSFATLTGVGTAGGTTKGVWREDGSPFVLRRESLGGAAVLSEITSLQTGGGVAQVVGTRSGTGITTANNLAVFVNDQASAGTLRAYTKGEVVSSLFGSVLSVFSSPVISPNGISAIHGRLKLGGSLAVTAASDTLVSNQDVFSVLPQLGPIREGSSPVTGITLAEIAPRVAIGASTLVFASALAGDLATNQAIFSRNLSSGAVTKVARKGDVANVGGLGTEAFSAFLGETVNPAGTVAFRATIIGGNATAASNEALFVATPGSPPTAFAREGSAAPGSSLVINSFLSFRIATTGSVVFHATLKGTGITAANDQAIFVASPAGVGGPAVVVSPSHLLLREGDPLPGNDRAIIGSILRVAYDDRGGYQVLVSLVSRAGEAGAADNQALLYGESKFRFIPANDGPGMRKAFVQWRKGWAFQQPGATLLKSLSFSPLSLAPTGASGTGRGDVLQQGLPLCTMQFTDNRKLVFRGGYNFD